MNREGWEGPRSVLSFVAVALVGVVGGRCTAVHRDAWYQPELAPSSVPSSMAVPDPSASATFPQPTDTAAQSHTPVTLASLGPVPTGRWTSIHWTQVMAPPVFLPGQANGLAKSVTA